MKKHAGTTGQILRLLADQRVRTCDEIRAALHADSRAIASALLDLYKRGEVIRERPEVTGALNPYHYTLPELSPLLLYLREIQTPSPSRLGATSKRTLAVLSAAPLPISKLSGRFRDDVAPSDNAIRYVLDRLIAYDLAAVHTVSGARYRYVYNLTPAGEALLDQLFEQREATD